MTQGKCIDCKIIYTWSGKPLLRDANCNICKKKLERTTHRLGTSSKTGFRIGNWKRETLRRD